MCGSALVLAFVAVITISTSYGLAPPLPRRTVLHAIASAVLVPPIAAKAATDTNIILGTYTDPVNHPGGTRTIELTGTGLAGYQLARITGGGGLGEPASFELPAMISPCPGRPVAGRELCITIDFSPKGGPPVFTGYWDPESKGIRFPVDGNFWPKQ